MKAREDETSLRSLRYKSEIRSWQVNGQLNCVASRLSIEMFDSLFRCLPAAETSGTQVEEGKRSKQRKESKKAKQGTANHVHNDIQFLMMNTRSVLSQGSGWHPSLFALS